MKEKNFVPAEGKTNNPDAERAVALLRENPSLTCAFVRGAEEETSEKRGVAPLLETIDAGRSLEGFSAADRVVGRAAALLYVFLRAKEVRAGVLSKGGEEAFRAHGIAYEREETTERIVNRAKTGLCPMEEATEGILDPAEGLAAVRKRLKTLSE